MAISRSRPTSPEYTRAWRRYRLEHDPVDVLGGRDATSTLPRSSGWRFPVDRRFHGRQRGVAQ